MRVLAAFLAIFAPLAFADVFFDSPVSSPTNQGIVQLAPTSLIGFTWNQSESADLTQVTVKELSNWSGKVLPGDMNIYFLTSAPVADETYVIGSPLGSVPISLAAGLVQESVVFDVSALPAIPAGQYVITIEMDAAQLITDIAGLTYNFSAGTAQMQKNYDVPPTSRWWALNNTFGATVEGTPTVPPPPAGALDPDTQLAYVGSIVAYGTAANGWGWYEYDPNGAGSNPDWPGTLFAIRQGPNSDLNVIETTFPTPEQCTWATASRTADIAVLNVRPFITGWALDEFGADRVGGVALHGDGNLYVSYRNYYNTTPMHLGGIMRCDRGLTTCTDLGPLGPAASHVEGSEDHTWNPKKHTGYIQSMPPAWCLSEFGFDDCLSVGNTGTPGSQHGDNGGIGSFFVFDPDSLITAENLMSFTTYLSVEEDLSLVQRPNPITVSDKCEVAQPANCTTWSRADWWHGGTVIDSVTGSRALMVVGRQGLLRYDDVTGTNTGWLDTCYGNVADKCFAVARDSPEAATVGYPVTIDEMASQAYGNNGDPHLLQVYLYTMENLEEVAAGSRDRWNVQPYALWDFQALTKTDAGCLGDPVYNTASFYRNLSSALFFTVPSGANAGEYLMITEERGVDPAAVTRPVGHIFAISAPAARTISASVRIELEENGDPIGSLEFVAPVE